jgi:hypothetical protein
MFSRSSIAQFYGSENMYFNPLFKAIKYTEGVQHLQDGGGWIVTDALAQLMGNKKLKSEEFLVVKFAPNGKGGAIATYDDGNNNVLVRQEYDVSDIPCEVMMYRENGVLMLVGER